MKFNKVLLAMACISSSLYAVQDKQLQREIQSLQNQTTQLQKKIDTLQRKLASSSAIHHQKTTEKKSRPAQKINIKQKSKTPYHSSHVIVHTPEVHPESMGFYPSALIADKQVVTYIAGLL